MTCFFCSFLNCQISISQVVTESDLVSRSNLLEGALASGSFAEFCRTKIESCSGDLDSTLWCFLKVNRWTQHYHHYYHYYHHHYCNHHHHYYYHNYLHCHHHYHYYIIIIMNFTVQLINLFIKTFHQSPWVLLAFISHNHLSFRSTLKANHASSFCRCLVTTQSSWPKR